MGDGVEWVAADGTPGSPPRVFLDSLLADPDIRFIAAYQDQRIVAGAIAYRAGRVVGISTCLFWRTTQRLTGQAALPP